MPVALEQFVKNLQDSGVIPEESLQDFLPPKRQLKDADELASELVRQRKLTKFQVEQVSQGKGKALVLGNYLLLERIGAGGMGQVFKAQHRRMGRIVAVKVLPASLMKDPATIARFEREVRAVARISHPNIVVAFDAGRAGDIHFLVMEYVEGRDLSAQVRKHGALPVDLALDYLAQTARGLDAAHQGGIVHRDIKPANLLLTRDGKVKILDMGLARLASEGEAGRQAELTSTGTIMGTVDYMAPEQALNTKSADARADIYSLGCSLYYLLTGQPIYTGDTLIQRLLAHREGPIPSLRKARPEVSEPIDHLFQRMVAKRVEDRYQTMAEVLADLELVKSGSSVARSIAPPGSSIAPSFADEWTDFRNAVESSAPALAVTPSHVSRAGRSGHGRLWMGILAAVLGTAVLLGGFFVSRKPSDGTLVVTVNESEAQVEVLSPGGRVELARKTEEGPMSLQVVPGLHRLRVEKEGFVVVTRDFEIESNSTTSITANLKPVEKKPAVAASPAPEPPRPQAEETDPQRRLGAWLMKNKLPFLTDRFNSRSVRDLPPGSWKVISVEVNGLTDELAAQFVEQALPVTTLTSLYLRPTSQFTRAGLAELVRLKSLTSLGGNFGQVAGKDLELLLELPLLFNVGPGDSPLMDDSALAALQTHPHVTVIGFNNCPISDAGVETLKGMPQLMDVYFNSDRLTDNIWQSLGQLPELKSLSIVLSPRITGTGLSNLRGTQVEYLTLGSLSLSNDSLREMASLPTLKVLNLDNNPIDDEGLKHLAGTSLIKLVVTKTKVTEEGVKALAALLPRCQIEWNGGVISPTATAPK